MKQWISYFRMEITQSSPKARTMIGAHNTQTYLRTHKENGRIICIREHTYAHANVFKRAVKRALFRTDGLPTANRREWVGKDKRE